MSGASTSADLSIRARPKPVRRFSKKILLIGAGGTAAAIAFALQPVEYENTHSTELYNTTHKPVAEAIERLPKSYAELTPPKSFNVETAIPTLGPPLPGDLGAAYIETKPKGSERPAQNPFKFNAGATRTDSVNIRRRQVVEASDPIEEMQEKVRSSDLFFSVSHAPQSNRPLSQNDPFAGISALAGADGGFDFTETGLASPASNTDREIYNSSELQSPKSPYQVMAGTLIPATLVTGLNSDLPGQVIGQVTENIHDTVTGRHLLVPQGAKLIGTYESRNSFGQTRAFVSWTRLIFPNGDSIVLDDLGAVDGQGFAGLRDKVDGHTGKIIKASVLSSVLGIGAELATDDDDRIIRALQNSGQQTLNVAGQRMVDRSLGVEPTITIRPGWRFSVLVSRDLILKPYSN